MCQSLTVNIRNEIVRDLVTQMYAMKKNPDKDFCTTVAKPLVEDNGRNVTGYVSEQV